MLMVEAELQESQRQQIGMLGVGDPVVGRYLQRYLKLYFGNEGRLLFLAIDIGKSCDVEMNFC